MISLHQTAWYFQNPNPGESFIRSLVSYSSSHLNQFPTRLKSLSTTIRACPFLTKALPSSAIPSPLPTAPPHQRLTTNLISLPYQRRNIDVERTIYARRRQHLPYRLNRHLERVRRSPRRLQQVQTYLPRLAGTRQQEGTKKQPSNCTSGSNAGVTKKRAGGA